MIAEHWKYTPLKGLEALELPFAPVSLAAPCTELPWENLTENLPSHPAVQKNGQAWLLDIPANTTVETDLVFTATSGHQQNHGVLVRLGTNSRLVLKEQHSGAEHSLSRALMRFELGENAELHHLRIQQHGHHLGLTIATLARNARLHHTALCLGSPLARHEAEIRLTAPGAEAFFTAVNLLDKTSHGDVTTRILHEAPQGTSRQSVRTVLCDQSRGVFQGLVRVAPLAQKTDGRQLSRALLLSPTAEMDAKPELEIFADDVKCSHGAAIGALDDLSLFYLRARGLDEAAARQLLVSGFVGEVLEPLLPALRPVAEALVNAWLERLP